MKKTQTNKSASIALDRFPSFGGLVTSMQRKDVLTLNGTPIFASISAHVSAHPSSPSIKKQESDAFRFTFTQARSRPTISVPGPPPSDVTRTGSLEHRRSRISSTSIEY